MRKYFKHLGVEGETERNSATKPLGEVTSEKKSFALLWRGRGMTQRERDQKEGSRGEN